MQTESGPPLDSLGLVGGMHNLDRVDSIAMHSTLLVGLLQACQNLQGPSHWHSQYSMPKNLVYYI
ncbi:MAG: hypothetical protein NVS4B11_09850 [Ktedonobacteraceae bacterium]